MKGIWFAAPGAAVVAVGLSPLMSRRVQAPLAVDLSFTAYSEGLEPISGARVKLQGAANHVLNSGVDGHTASFPSYIGAVYDVHLKERALSFGTALGQSVYGYTVPAGTLDASTSSERLWETILTQPVLRPVVVDSAHHRVGNPADELWDIDIDDANHDTFSFPALVGSLSTEDSVAYYFDYCDIDPLEPNYRYALALRTTAIESFGSHGAVIAIDCSSFGFSEEPVVDICFVATSAQHFGATTLAIDASYWRSQTLRLSVSGSIGNGTTLLLVRPDGGSPHSLQEVVASPPTFGPVTVPYGGGAADPEPQRCTPKEPDPATEAECTPPEPPPIPDMVYCPFAPTKAGPTVVTSDIRRVGAKVCGDNGPPTEVTGTVDWGAQLSVNFDIAGVKITAGGDLKRTESVKTTCTPGHGNGCGECKQIYKIRVFCKQKWIVEIPTFATFYPHAFQSCEDDERFTGSVSEIIQETKCPMAGC